MVVSPPCLGNPPSPACLLLNARDFELMVGLHVQNHSRSLGLRVTHDAPDCFAGPVSQRRNRHVPIGRKLMVMFVGHCSYLGIRSTRQTVYEVSLESPKAPGGSRGRDGTF
jgi:hypothetical protein